MEVHGGDVVRPCDRQHVRNQLGGDGCAALQMMADVRSWHVPKLDKRETEKQAVREKEGEGPYPSCPVVHKDSSG